MANDEAEEANETADEANSESETEMHSVKEKRIRRERPGRK